MAKVAPRRTRRSPERQTNWLLIGGIGAVGVVGLFALLFVTLGSQGVPTPTPEVELSLSEFCLANEENCVVTGDDEAPVTVVEISDYGCSHCRNFNSGTAQALAEQYVETGQVRWIVLPYALGSQTQPSAEAAMCARDQGAFPEFHQRLFDIQTTAQAHTREGFVEAAETLGLDVDAFEQCFDSGRYSQEVQRNIIMASQAGVSATPTFFINGKKVEGNLPLSNFQREIETAAQS